MMPAHDQNEVLRRLAVNLEKMDLSGVRAVVGFDGFVDEISTVVGSRTGAETFEAVRTIGEFGAMVSGAAGRSFGREVVVKRVEGGGNGPNLADGLVSLGVRVDLFGTMGSPRHPAFDEIAARCGSCTSIGTKHGRTLALEFGDGKLMLNETSGLGELDGALMRAFLSTGAYGLACKNAAVIGLANWSRYPYMTACWRLVVEEVLAALPHRPWIMVDLADPTGRQTTEVVELLGVVGAMRDGGRAVLGMNLNEAGVLLGHIQQTKPEDEAESMMRAGAALREVVKTEMVVIHSQRRAACATADGTWAVDGAYTSRPVRTTGVGDRFNAGVCAGLLSGMEARACLLSGCAAGGFFVRNGRCGSARELAGMCREWAEGRLTGG